MVVDLTEEREELQLVLRAAQSIDARTATYDALVDLCGVYVRQGLTEEAANVLAWVLAAPDVPESINERAAEHWELLETRICPRVMLDAKTFAAEMSLADICGYVLPEAG